MTKNDCVFCDRNAMEDRIIAEDETALIVPTLGQITEGGYTLLIPKRHTPCLAALPAEEISFASSWLGRLGTATALEWGGNVLFCEHGVVGQTINHAHMHIIPMAFNPTGRIVADFPNATIQYIASLHHLHRLYRQHRESPYLLWKAPGGHWHVCWDPPAEPQYFRIIAAKAYGLPERADWRSVPRDRDERLQQETVERLQQHL